MAQHMLVEVSQASQTVLGSLLFPGRCGVTCGLLCLSFISPRLGQTNFVTVQTEGHCSHNDTTVTVTVPLSE